MIRPTRVASTSEVEARITVAHTFPASRDTVENRADVKATQPHKGKAETSPRPRH